MADTRQSIRLSLYSRRDELDGLHDALCTFAQAAGVDARGATRFVLACEELVMNSITHAYPSNKEGQIGVELYETGAELIVVICDEGVPFNPLLQEKPDLESSLEQREPGGLGIWLARSFAQLSYERQANRNRLKLVFSKQRGGE